MRHSLRVTLPGLLAVGAVVGLAGPASAANTMHGGCYLLLQADPSNGPDRYVDFMGVNSTTQDSTGAPVIATVECLVEIDGIPTPSSYYSATGTGSQSGGKVDGFYANPNPVFTLCQRVSYASTPLPGSTWTCKTVTVGYTPPPP
jgi:hypothetical protein